jgi:hypothetical protein
MPEGIMEKERTGGRALKRQVRRILEEESLGSAIESLCCLPARQVVNPLISFFCSTDEMLKWYAVSAMGIVVGRLFEQRPESARVVMRRLMWSLNDESGGIGWGAPEAMAEIMVHSQALADEFSCLLISYLDPDGNYLEHEILQRGALWSAGRLAHERPDLMAPAAVFLPPYLQSVDPFHRGLAAWAAAALGADRLKPLLEALADDTAELRIYMNGRLEDFTVGRLARGAL